MKPKDHEALTQAILAEEPIYLEEWAQKLGVCPAQIRSILSFYTDLHHPADALRVCRGTSCQLDPKHQVRSAVGRPVYCLGRCYAAPNVLDAAGRVWDRKANPYCEPDTWHFLDPKLDHCPVYSLSEPLLSRRLHTTQSAQIDQAISQGVYGQWRTLLGLTAQTVLDQVEASGLRGRGGAGFPVGRKWRTCAEQTQTAKTVVVNGDEGDPGSFIDRVLMENDPHSVLEGLAICAYAVGAHQAIVYIRSEYPYAQEVMAQAIESATAHNLLGQGILGTDFDLEVSIHSGHGSYVCGEETALLNALEGRRGEVRVRPPFPAVSGYLGKPTVVNNVETLASVPRIFDGGPEAYRQRGTADSAGTKLMCLNHGFNKPGIYEVEFGTSLKTLFEAAGGTENGDLVGILLGGPMGSVVLPKDFDTPICYRAMGQKGIQLGHGGIVALRQDFSPEILLHHWVEFMRDESCGKCAPCSLGSKQLANWLEGPLPDQSQFLELLSTISKTALCAFGQLIPQGISQFLSAFPQAWEENHDH
ncbi:MAG: NADH-quinone oxidoreductase subunit D [Acidobacteria bacterium]|nr:NADH-quinone oxidoreductase subunit D [Acidobacteriota bacterium]MCB9398388.1 NADH-quinone oxidoreductase subunit D [Acidobacteriota bacterium]